MTTPAAEPPKIRVIKAADVERKLAPRFARKINKLTKETELQENSGANNLDVILSPSRRRWQVIKNSLVQIVEYGRKEGILAPKGKEVNPSDDKNDDQKQNKINEKKRQIDEDLIKITNEDVSAAHSAIPYLPVPLAICCLIFNIIVPGSGTIISGLAVTCVGQPRMVNDECRLFFAVFINFMVGLAQMCTITFFLVGWFWSIAWGGLMLTYSLEYRKAMIKQRQEAVATAAIEALTRDAVLRQKDVRRLVNSTNVSRLKQSGSRGRSYSNKRPKMPMVKKLSGSLNLKKQSDKKENV